MFNSFHVHSPVNWYYASLQGAKVFGRQNAQAVAAGALILSGGHSKCVTSEG